MRARESFPAVATLVPLFVPGILAAGCALSVYLTRGNSFRFQDGSFSLHAPFWRILPENMARLFWFWGLLGLAAAWRHPAVHRAVLWAAIALLPYSFLTYSARVPSRQLYLASAGVAIVVGSALHVHRRIAAVACALLLIHNIGYLWIRKRAQFLERAEPTQQLIALAKSTTRPVYIQCFPRPGLIAEEAVHLGAGRAPGNVIWDAAEARRRDAVTFCYAPKAAN